MKKITLLMINMIVSAWLFAEVNMQDTESKEPNKIVKVINKIDKKVNPEINFYVPNAYGTWYVTYTTNPAEVENVNFNYEFKKESLGYKINKNFYDEDSKSWITSTVRGWIEEVKGVPYLRLHKKYLISSKNTILFFDGLESNDGTIAEYTHMIIQFTESDGTVVTRVLSRTKDDKLGSDNSQNIINATAFIKVKQIEMSDNK